MVVKKEAAATRCCIQLCTCGRCNSGVIVPRKVAKKVELDRKCRRG